MSFCVVGFFFNFPPGCANAILVQFMFSVRDDVNLPYYAESDDHWYSTAYSDESLPTVPPHLLPNRDAGTEPEAISI